MFYVYILESEKTGRHYYGMTTDVDQRLHYHNKGHVRSTRFYRPWRIILVEQYDTRLGARERELELKKSYAKRKGALK